MKKYAPVMGITWKGKGLILVLRSLLFLISIFKHRDWQYPIRNFEEDPRYFTLKDSIYLAYKYYYQRLVNADKHSGIPAHFNAQQFNTEVRPTHLTISLGGDLMPYRYINKKICSNLWSECGSYFFSSDIVFANLETPLNINKKSSVVPEVMLNNMLFNGNAEIFDVFNGGSAFKGFDVLSVANNHSLDQGIDGLQHTLQFLKERNIAYAGAAQTIHEVDDFPIILKNGIATAFIAFTFSLNKFSLPPGYEWMCNHIRLNKQGIDISSIVKQAALARKRGADIVVASLHMGNAYQPYPSKHTIETIHRICSEAGIDVVVAGHPHNPQPVEWFEYADQHGEIHKSLIFYSLGDFVGYDIYTLTHFSLLVKLHITKTGNKVSISDVKVLPAYLMADYEAGKLHKLTFKHLDGVNEERKQTAYIEKELCSINQFYKNVLFTKVQRNQLILNPHIYK